MILIDANALKEAVKKNGVAIDGTINGLPHINIVQCKECKHWERLNYEAPKEGWCNTPMIYCDGKWTDADDYCSYGEREGE